MGQFSSARAQAHLAEDISSERRIVEKAIQALNTAIDKQTIEAADEIDEMSAASYLIGGDMGKIMGQMLGPSIVSEDLVQYDLDDFLPEHFNPIHFTNVIQDANYDAGVYYYDLMNQMAFDPQAAVLDMATMAVANKAAGKGPFGGKGENVMDWSPLVEGYRSIRDSFREHEEE